MCISAFSWPPRISVPPWSFDTCSSSRWNEAGESTSLWWGMRSVSYSNSYFSMPISNYSCAYSISWAKSCPYDGSPCSPDASCWDESTTCIGAASSVYTWCAPYWIYCYCTSFSYWCNSCSFRSFSLNSCNSFSASSILFLSLCLRVIRLSHCCLFAWISIATYSTRGSARNLKLFSSSMRSTIFLFPLSWTCMLSFTSSVAVATVGVPMMLLHAASLTTLWWS